MSFYRTILAAVAAVAIASPVFADDTTSTGTTDNNAQATQPADNSTASTSATTSTNNDATSSQGTSSTDANATSDKINLNKATVKELMKVKGLNASKARAIVAYRKKHGDFKSTDELANVKGFKKMKPDTLKEITDQLTIE